MLVKFSPFVCKHFVSISACSHCKRPVKDVDIEQLKNLPQEEINLFKLYQQEKILEKKDTRNNKAIAVSFG